VRHESADRLAAERMENFRKLMRKIRPYRLKDQAKEINQAVRGHYAYYGLGGNCLGIPIKKPYMNQNTILYSITTCDRLKIVIFFVGIEL